MKLVAAAALVLIVAIAGCSSGVEAPTPTQDLEATVRAAVEQALPTSVPTAMPDVDATIEAGVSATMTATPPTPVPAPTPVPTPTSISIPAPTPTPTETPNPPLPDPLIIRSMSEWTAENPASFEEIEAELQKYRGETLNVTSWGGTYQPAQRQAYFQPFQQKFGIQIIEDYPVNYPRLRSMVEAGNVTWDVVDSATRAVYPLGTEGFLEELTPAIHNRYLPHFPQVAQTPWSGGGGVLWSTGLAYQLDSVDTLWGGKRPSDWSAFWDTENYPGRRWLGERVNENIFFAQFALNPKSLESAEGRNSIAKLTPEQVNQSFEKLAEIEPHIDYWWRGSRDCMFGLMTNEVDMCTSWNAEIWNYRTEPEAEGVRYCYECGHVIQNNLFYIPRGSPNRTLAELFISWTAEPHINVEISNYVPYGPLNQQALPLATPDRVNPEVIPYLPTSPTALERAVPVDEKWLGSNLDALAKRMGAFLAGN